jgi:Helicase HerA-like C-terminal
LLTKIEQVVRLIRSKGVGVYFVTQNPVDVPDTVLGQLGNRVQHALRAFTPRDQKAVTAAAQTFRSNPKLDVATVITQFEVGEALGSFLDEKGTPGIVERAYVCPPHGQIGPITPEERRSFMANSLVAGVYEQAVDRESAYERLKARSQSAAGPSRAMPPQTQPPAGQGTTEGGAMTGVLGELGGLLMGSVGPRGGRREGILEAMVKSGARSMGSQLGGQIVRGVLGSILGGSGVAQTVKLALNLWICSFVLRTAAPAIFDLNADFSPARNPNTVWQYGYSRTNSLARDQFQIDRYADTSNPVVFWHPDKNNGPGPGYYPYVAYNTTHESRTNVTNGWAVRAGEVAMEASNTGQYSLIRFVAPRRGNL